MAEKIANKKKKNLMQYGSIIFGIGLLISIVSIFIPLTPSMNKVVISTLILFGIIIGFLNIRNDEVQNFLLAAITLVILFGPFLGLLGQYLLPTDYMKELLSKFFTNLVALIVPAAIVVSVKTLFLTAKDE